MDGLLSEQDKKELNSIIERLRKAIYSGDVEIKKLLDEYVRKFDEVVK